MGRVSKHFARMPGEAHPLARVGVELDRVEGRTERMVFNLQQERRVHQVRVLVPAQ